MPVVVDHELFDFVWHTIAVIYILLPNGHDSTLELIQGFRLRF